MASSTASRTLTRVLSRTHASVFDLCAMRGTQAVIDGRIGKEGIRWYSLVGGHGRVAGTVLDTLSDLDARRRRENCLREDPLSGRWGGCAFGPAGLRGCVSGSGEQADPQQHRAQQAAAREAVRLGCGHTVDHRYTTTSAWKVLRVGRSGVNF